MKQTCSSNETGVSQESEMERIKQVTAGFPEVTWEICQFSTSNTNGEVVLQREGYDQPFELCVCVCRSFWRKSAKNCRRSKRKSSEVRSQTRQITVMGSLSVSCSLSIMGRGSAELSLQPPSREGILKSNSLSF